MRPAWSHLDGGRRADVLRWLAACWNRRQVSPTSAELAKFHVEHGTDGIGADWSWDRRLLYVRRGLSDLQTTGTVVAAGARLCGVTRRRCETWRVRERGA